MDSAFVVKRTFVELDTASDVFNEVQTFARPRAESDTCIDYSFTEDMSLGAKKASDDFGNRATTAGSLRTSEASSSRWCDDDASDLEWVEEACESLFASDDEFADIPLAPSASLETAPCQPPGSFEPVPAGQTAMASCPMPVGQMGQFFVMMPMMPQMAPVQPRQLPKEEEGARRTLECTPSDKKPSTKPQSKEVRNSKAKSKKEAGKLTTTVVMRQLPTNISSTQVRRMLDSADFVGLYDFLYLPMDFKTSKNLGYALVNFSSHAHAVAAKETLNLARMGTNEVTVEFSNKHTGLASLLQMYQGSRILQDLDMPDEYKPMLFSNGKVIPFDMGQ